MNAKSSNASARRNKPWLVPLMLALLIASLAWIGYSVFLTGGPVVLDSPRDLFMQEIREKLAGDPRFTHVECTPSLEDETSVFLFGELEYDSDADDLRALIGPPPEGLSVTMQVEARPG